MRAGTLIELLDRNVKHRPAQSAATDADGTLDWRSFAARVNGYAGQLDRQGIGRGDRVALWLPNSVDYLALIFACARLAALAVHINTRFRASEVKDLLKRSGATVLVTDFDFPPVDFAGILDSVLARDRFGLRAIVGRKTDARAIAGVPVVPLAEEGAAPSLASAESPCLTFTTSGTTSGPKLVLHSQGSIAGHACDAAAALATAQTGACVLAVVPLCGTFGNALAMAGIAGGAHIVLMDRFDAEQAQALIRRHRVTHTAGGDDMLARLAQAAAGRPYDSVVFTGYASFSPTATESIAAADRAGLMPRGLYGSSELQALFAIAPDSRRLTDGGVPVSAQAEISIRHPESGAPMPPGEVGELCVKAPSAFLGYLENPQATARATTPDGFFRSGDLCRLAPPGFVYDGRLGDTLRLGGFLVHPEEIEAFLQRQPGVAAAQVVAVERGGDRVAVAFICAEPGRHPDEAGILAACRANLAGYKVPARLITLEAFPTTESPNGVKIQRAKLREMAEEMLREPLAHGSAAQGGAKR
jgi:fatty-acyl-CoA synthase